MWDKFFRAAMVNTVYQDIFWKNIEIVNEIDTDFIVEQMKKNLSEKSLESFNVDTKQLDEKLVECEANYTEHKKFLLKYLEGWYKTYDIVKAILFVFLIERMDAESKGLDIGDVVGKYIKLTQDIVGGKSTSLVHAILSKITGGEDLKKAESATVEQK